MAKPIPRLSNLDGLEHQVQKASKPTCSRHIIQRILNTSHSLNSWWILRWATVVSSDLNMSCSLSAQLIPTPLNLQIQREYIPFVLVLYSLCCTGAWHHTHLGGLAFCKWSVVPLWLVFGPHTKAAVWSWDPDYHNHIWPFNNFWLCHPHIFLNSLLQIKKALGD